METSRAKMDATSSNDLAMKTEVSDLAEVYGFANKQPNEHVKRNLEWFSESFRFQLTDAEKDELVAHSDRFDSLKHSSSNPYAFTEPCLAMLSAVQLPKIINAPFLGGASVRRCYLRGCLRFKSNHLR